MTDLDLDNLEGEMSVDIDALQARVDNRIRELEGEQSK